MTDSSAIHQLFPPIDEKAEAINEPAPEDRWRDGVYERVFIEEIVKYPEQRAGGHVLIRWPAGNTFRRTDGVRCARYSTGRSTSTMPLDRWKAWCARESTHLLVRGTTPDAAARKRAQNLLRFHSIVELSGEVRWETLPPGELVGKPAPMTRVDTGRAVFKDGARIEWENIRTSEGQGVRIRTWFGGKETKETVLLVPHRVYGEPDNWPAAFWMHIGMRVGALHAPAVADMLERAALSGGVREIRRDGDND